MITGGRALTNEEHTSCRTMCQRTLTLLPRGTMLIVIWLDTLHKHTPIRRHRPNAKQVQALELDLPHQPLWQEKRNSYHDGTSYPNPFPAFRQNSNSSNSNWELRSVGDWRRTQETYLHYLMSPASILRVWREQTLPRLSLTSLWTS